MLDKLKSLLSVRFGPQIRQQLSKNKNWLALLALAFVFFVSALYVFFNEESRQALKSVTPKEIAEKYNLVNPTPQISPSPTPSPRPLTFAEMNTLYGPCVYVPTLMYHHIQNMAIAKTKGQQNLTVDTAIFAKQMQYLKDAGYQVIPMASLVSFFDSGTPLPKKSVLLTFDDGYDDFYLNAFPVLQRLDFPATMFTPTGLIGNPGYLSWGQVASASGGGILFANHTWSHKGMRADGSIDEKEIATADVQLSQNGLDNPKVFAYPYGTVSDIAQAILTKYGYRLAFTTKHGGTLCVKQRLVLPRIRIGNATLSAFGF